MGGTQTAGFDLVMQFSEDAYHELLGVFLDSEGRIKALSALLPGGASTNAFTLAVSLDRPTDVPVAASAVNPLDVRIGLGEDGRLASFRIVVGILVDRSAPDQDVVVIDFAGATYFAQVTVLGVALPIPGLAQKLGAILGKVKVLPVNVDRGGTDPTRPIRTDFKIIDDQTPADADATAAMLTFGGGAPGNESALASFVPAGERGAIAVYFQWLCRMAVGPMEQALELPPGSFDLGPSRCSLNRTVRVDDEEEVDLTSLVLSLEDGYIGIRAHVTKSGFCYDAAGDVSARLLLKIEGGRLKAEVQLAEPDVDVDIPWYCYVVGAAIGAVLGGLLLGVIGAIVGAVLVPLIMWIASDVVEKTIEDAAGSVAGGINQGIPEVNVPAYGIQVIFQEVFVDDVLIRADVDVQDHAPIRGEGTVRLQPGQGLDLDTGRVGGAEAAPGDLRWLGLAFDRRLETGCQAMLARTGRQDLDGVSRFELYGLPYQARASVGVGELGSLDAFGMLRGDPIDETRTVLGVRTNEGRFAMVQATQVDLMSWVDLRYRTYDLGRPSLAIHGGFACRKVVKLPEGAAAAFLPALDAAGAPERVPLTVAAAAVGKRVQEGARGGDALSARPALQPAAGAVARGTRVFPLAGAFRGRWVATVDGPAATEATLRAVADGFGDGAAYRWSIGGKVVPEEAELMLQVDGAEVRATASGATLTIQAAGGGLLELFVQVEARDSAGVTAQASRCVRRPAKCVTQVRQVPPWAVARQLHQLPAEVVASGLVGSKLGRLERPGGLGGRGGGAAGGGAAGGERPSGG